jgi:RNA polymerase sigma-70 factor (ECF subfamily)
MIGRAADSDPAASRTALDQLLRTYLPALRHHLVSLKRLPLEQLDDLLQSFVAAKFLEANLAATADRGRGKFRTLLLTSLDRFLISERRKRAAAKRGAGRISPEDAGELEVADADQHCPSWAFDVAWARELLAEVLRGMRAECEHTGRPDLWAVFDCRLMQPLLSQAAPIGYDELVRRFGYPSPTHAANALVTGKRMFQRHLRAAVARYARSETEIDEEVRELCAALARGHAESRG